MALIVIAHDAAIKADDDADADCLFTGALIIVTEDLDVEETCPS